MVDASDPPPGLSQTLQQHGQQHLLASWQNLGTQQRQELVKNLKDVDFPNLVHAFNASTACADEHKAIPEPLTHVTTQQDVTEAQRSDWTQAGYRMIAEGKMAVLVLAGGQGSRLGSSAPKGCYDIGLPSHKSLFQLQAERIGRLQRLAAETVGGAGAQVRHPMRLYLMTSGSTDAATKAHFEEHGFFGLDRDQVVFFQQGQLPCLTRVGKVIMATEHSIAQAPDGNGGVYIALEKSGVLADMAAHGVEAVDCCAVDNVLAPLGDPLFAGHCAAAGAECGARVVAKRSPSEKVGVFARRGDAIEVVEYSELGAAEAEAALEDGGLKYNWSNVCMHYFQRSFLERMARQLVSDGRFHIANKKIPSKDGPVQGIKLELFIFDTFPLARAVSLMEVPRAEQFSPLKNGPGEAEDSPDSGRRDVMQLHARWVTAAGGKVEAAEGVEVSPTVSYAGEGLEGICRGRTFAEPEDAALQGAAAQ